MKEYRIGLFETNSSSTHTITICSKEDYENWKAGKLLYNYYEGELVDNYLLSEEKRLSKLKEYYDSIKKSYFKDFDSLTENEINDLLKDAVESGYMFSDLSKLNEDDLDWPLYTYDGFMHRETSLEDYFESFTTEHGDEIVVFGEYGYDG